MNLPLSLDRPALFGLWMCGSEPNDPPGKPAGFPMNYFRRLECYQEPKFRNQGLLEDDVVDRMARGDHRQHVLDIGDLDVQDERPLVVEHFVHG